MGRNEIEGTAKAERSWEPMTLTYVGDAGQLLEGGGGKKSPAPHDSGDIFKPPGQE